METLLAGGAEVDAADATGWTPLHLAARWGRARAARALLAAGANVNAKTAIGHTPLDWASAGVGGGGGGEAMTDEGAVEDVRDVLVGAGGVRALGEGQSVWDTFCRSGVSGQGAGRGREGGPAAGVNVFRDLTGEVLLGACSVCVLGIML